MRVLVIGSRKTWRMEAGVARALARAGHTPRLFDDRRAKQLVGFRLTQHLALATARRFRPDFVVLSKCHALAIETVARIVRGVPNAMWYWDGPWYEGQERPGAAHVEAVARLADVFFTNGFEEEWRAKGANAKYLPAAADRAIVPVPPDPAYAAEVAFTGSGYDPGRAEFLAEIARQYRLRVWGTGWERWRDRLDWSGRPVEGTEFATVCSSTGVMLGALPGPLRNTSRSASNRMWLTVLAGGFFLGARSPGVDRLLLDGVHCGWYRDLPDCLARIGHLLRHPAERERIRAEGERFVREHHTFDERVRHLLDGTEFVNPLGE